jgi:ATP-binding cassette subfamily B (MDR/TAP) protein 11
MRNMTLKFTNFAGKTMKFDLEQESEESTKFELSKILELVKDNKLDIVIGILGGLIYGAYIPCVSLLLGKITTSFALKDNSEMKKEVLKWALVLLAITIFAVVCNYFKALKLASLGSTVISKLRKKLFRKYLELHMGFYDFESNNPNELLSVITVEINYLRLIFTTILGAIVVTLGMIITAIIIGFYYDWKLTLILLCFFPFRLIFSYLVGKFKVGGKRKYKYIRICQR